ncbi:MAG TPA: RNA-binding protein, partial [Methylococcaceae bacterium]|nr:RNA-binding protein [Methylococcaceae bacterium]
NLPSSTTEQDITDLFSQYGKIRSLQLVSDIFSGECKGFGFIEMEGHEARIAITNLDGKDFKGKPLRVNFEKPSSKGRR